MLGGYGAVCFLHSQQYSNPHYSSSSTPSLLPISSLHSLRSLPSSASSNDSQAPPPPLCGVCSHPFSSHLPILLAPSHSPTFAHFLHQASNKLQVTFKKIDLFLPSLHPSHPPPPTSPHRYLCLFSVSSLRWSMFSVTD